jgi:hypothetical protein
MTATYKSQKHLSLALQGALLIWLVQNLLMVSVWLDALPMGVLGALWPLFTLSLLVLLIGFPVFFSRATKNLEAMGVAGLGYSSRQAAWSFFIPLVRWVRPYRIATELVRASTAAREEGYTTSWMTAPAAPRWVLGWFVAFMASTVSIRMSPGLLTDSDSWGRGMDGFLIFMSVLLVVKVLALGPAALLARRLVVTIHEGQEAMANPTPTDDGALLREGLGHVTTETPASVA